MSQLVGGRWEVTGIQGLEARDAANCLTVHRAAPSQTEIRPRDFPQSIPGSAVSSGGWRGRGRGGPVPSGGGQLRDSLQSPGGPPFHSCPRSPQDFRNLNVGMWPSLHLELAAESGAPSLSSLICTAVPYRTTPSCLYRGGALSGARGQSRLGSPPHPQRGSGQRGHCDNVP